MQSASIAFIVIIDVVIVRCQAATSVPHSVVRDCSMQSRNLTLALQLSSRFIGEQEQSFWSRLSGRFGQTGSQEKRSGDLPDKLSKF